MCRKSTLGQARHSCYYRSEKKSEDFDVQFFDGRATFGSIAVFPVLPLARTWRDEGLLSQYWAVHDDVPYSEGDSVGEAIRCLYLKLLNLSLHGPDAELRARARKAERECRQILCSDWPDRIERNFQTSRS